MNRDLSLVKKVEAFLSSYALFEKRLLLGYSGGVDSLVLFHLLLDIKKKKDFELIVLHVDHGWRSKSDQEALEIKNYIEGFQIRCYVAKVAKMQESEPPARNREDQARSQRIALFKEVCQKEAVDAVLLAHHADDQAETVLKRVLEGATLPHLSGMKPKTDLDGLMIYRPLLSFEKAELIRYSEKRHLKVVEDSTNFDRSNLRSRMRQDVFPSLNEAFGKNPKKGLLKLSAQLAGLEEYLSKWEKPLIGMIQKGAHGSWVDYGDAGFETVFEWQRAVVAFLQSVEFEASYALMQEIAKKCANDAAATEFHQGGKRLIVDRKRLFLPVQTTFNWELRVDLEPSLLNVSADWKKTWEGFNSVYLPKLDQGRYELKIVPLNFKLRLKDRTTTLDKWLSSHRVPAFLRKQWPVVTFNDTMVHEFWTGKTFELKGLPVLLDTVSARQELVLLKLVANGVEPMR